MKMEKHKKITDEIAINLRKHTPFQHNSLFLLSSDFLAGNAI